jgi:hypothetical protein
MEGEMTFEEAVKEAKFISTKLEAVVVGAGLKWTRRGTSTFMGVEDATGMLLWLSVHERGSLIAGTGYKIVIKIDPNFTEPGARNFNAKATGGGEYDFRPIARYLKVVKGEADIIRAGLKLRDAKIERTRAALRGCAIVIQDRLFPDESIDSGDRFRVFPGKVVFWESRRQRSAAGSRNQRGYDQREDAR